MLYPQNPRYQKPAPRPDLHTRFDKADMVFRMRVKQLAERQRRGDYSYLPDGDPAKDIRDTLRLKGSYSAKAVVSMYDRT